MCLGLTTLVPNTCFNCDRKKDEVLRVHHDHHVTPDKATKQTERSDTKRYSLVAKVLEEVAQDFESLDPYTLAL